MESPEADYQQWQGHPHEVGIDAGGYQVMVSLAMPRVWTLLFRKAAVASLEAEWSPGGHDPWHDHPHHAPFLP